MFIQEVAFTKMRKTSVTRILAFFHLLLRSESLGCLLQPHKGLLITFKKEAGGEGRDAGPSMDVCTSAWENTSKPRRRAKSYEIRTKLSEVTSRYQWQQKLNSKQGRLLLRAGGDRHIYVIPAARSSYPDPALDTPRERRRLKLGRQEFHFFPFFFCLLFSLSPQAERCSPDGGLGC